MSFLKKIFAALRGESDEKGNPFADLDSVETLEKEIGSAEKSINRIKRELDTISTEKNNVLAEIEKIKAQIENFENEIVVALNSQNDMLANETAEYIVDLEAELAVLKKTLTNVNASANQHEEQLKKAERDLAEFKRHLVMVKTTESVQRATSAITDNLINNNIKTMSATESLERIRQKQKENDDKLKDVKSFEAESAISSNEGNIEQAGNGPQTITASSVLERIKAKKGA